MFLHSVRIARAKRQIVIQLSLDHPGIHPPVRKHRQHRPQGAEFRTLRHMGCIRLTKIFLACQQRLQCAKFRTLGHMGYGKHHTNPLAKQQQCPRSHSNTKDN